MTDREDVNDLPSLDDLRRAFHLGMTRDEFYQKCDDLLPLKIAVHAVDVLGIRVKEGGDVRFFVNEQEGLVHCEYQGDPFLLTTSN